jgi:hypothetical protein
MSSQLPEGERIQALREALAAAREIKYEWDRVRALETLAPNLPVSLLQEALVAAREIESKECRVDALLSLAPYLPEFERTQVLREAMAVAQEIEDREMRAVSLAEWVVPLLVEFGHYDEALAAARLVPDDWRRSKAEIVVVREIRDKEVQKQALVKVLARLPKSLLEEALVILGIVDEKIPLLSRWQSLLQEASWKIRQRESPTIIKEAERDLSAIQEKETKAIVELSIKLAEQEYFEESLAMAQIIRNEASRAEVLVDLASRFPIPKPLLGKILATAWETAKNEPHLAQSPDVEPARLTRAELLDNLGRLAPIIAALGGSEAVAETYRAIQDVGRWWP